MGRPLLEQEVSERMYAIDKTEGLRLVISVATRP